MELHESERDWVNDAKELKASSARSYLFMIYYLIVFIVFSFVAVFVSLGTDFFITYSFSYMEGFSLIFLSLLIYIYSYILLRRRIILCRNIIHASKDNLLKVHSVHSCVIIDEGGPYYITKVDGRSKGIKGPIEMPPYWRFLIHKINNTDPEVRLVSHADAKIVEISGTGRIIRYGGDFDTYPEAGADWPSYFSLIDTKYVLLEFGGLSVRKQAEAGIAMPKSKSKVFNTLTLFGVLGFIVGVLILPFIKHYYFYSAQLLVLSLTLIVLGVISFFLILRSGDGFIIYNNNLKRLYGF